MHRHDVYDALVGFLEADPRFHVTVVVNEEVQVNVFLHEAVR
jgi:hypothetical protein